MVRGLLWNRVSYILWPLGQDASGDAVCPFQMAPWVLGILSNPLGVVIRHGMFFFITEHQEVGIESRIFLGGLLCMPG